MRANQEAVAQAMLHGSAPLPFSKAAKGLGWLTRVSGGTLYLGQCAAGGSVRFMLLGIPGEVGYDSLWLGWQCAAGGSAGEPGGGRAGHASRQRAPLSQQPRQGGVG